MLSPSVFLSLAVLFGAPQQEPQYSLKAPSIVFAIASAADWTSTYHAVAIKGGREPNEWINWVESPGRMVALGAAMDVGGYFLWKKLMKRHRKWAAAGLYAMSAWRAYLVYRNVRVRSVK